MKNLNLILCLALSLLLTSSLTARTITVDDDNPADFNNIQAAIHDANNGDTVLVADGTYTGTGNHDIDFLGKPITVKSQNGPQNCIIDCANTPNNYLRGFYFHSQEDANSVLDGFTVTHAYFAIMCYQSSPKITNCTIIDNSGMGIFCEQSSPTITACRITENKTGILCNEASSPTITDCQIVSNIGYDVAGGIICWDYASPTIKNSKIIGNEGFLGGGISCIENSSLTIINCTISDNLSEWTGGIYCKDNSSVEVDNCTISNNSGDDSGGIFCMGQSSLTITNSTISGNSAKYWTGGITCIYSSELRMDSCLISDNSSGLGRTAGGIDCSAGSNAIITNCRISGNMGTSGSGIYSENSSDLIITNCTITGNLARNSGGGIFCSNNSDIAINNCILSDNEAEDGNQICLEFAGNASVNHCDIQDGQAGVYVFHNATLNWQQGNIEADPCFVNPGHWSDPGNTPDDIRDDIWTDGDYHLLADSPCIDAGDPCYVPEPNDTDLDGNPRVIADIIDMGAYEVQLDDPRELLDMLADDLIDLDLHKGIKNSLLAKIDMAIDKLEDDNENNDVAAINSLQAFINAVNAQRGKKISQADADDLIANAQQIIESLNSQ